MIIQLETAADASQRVAAGNTVLLACEVARRYHGFACYPTIDSADGTILKELHESTAHRS